MKPIHAALLFCTGLATMFGCDSNVSTKIVLVRERMPFDDPEADIRAMARRLSGAGVANAKMERRGDTVEFTFSRAKGDETDWGRILTRPGILATSELARGEEVPRFLTTLHLRFGRGTDLHPDREDNGDKFASVALIDTSRRAEVDAAMETIEFISILGSKVKPAWGAMPGTFDKDGVRRYGTDLFLLPAVPRGLPVTNDIVDSATYVQGVDSTRNGVDLHLSRQGRVAYLEMTQEMMGSFVAILVDDRLLEAAKVVQPVSSDRFWVGGCGSDCRNLAAILDGGPVRGTWRIVAR